MALKTYNPITPSTRQLVTIDRSDLWAGRPHKPLVEGLKKSGGRNNRGRMTVRHRGGGHKVLYRIIDFKRHTTSLEGTVERIEYDPNRTAHIALIDYGNDVKKYIIAPQRLSVGDKVIASEDADIKVGNALPLSRIPIGTIIHNIELKPLKGAQIARSAGTYAQYVGRDLGKALLRLSSGELRMVPLQCWAVIGVVSNPDKKNTNLGKAGRSRWLGRRPHVRGVVMNPVDHPHGGGEGRTSGGRHPVTPWGKSTKGMKTRNKKKSSSKMIVSRSKSRR
ncbi:MAG: 50S ribosomal protein L2 [Rickettsiales bacterium]|nr:50S ribosomal protein L2 [Rickettsiales bacterium]|tara:strand:- start:14536 stop:15369 length:834 start_codon:yes stop_codon:yes gene_type:complete